MPPLEGQDLRLSTVPFVSKPPIVKKKNGAQSPQIKSYNESVLKKLVTSATQSDEEEN